METTRPPFTSVNVVCAVILLLNAALYVVPIVAFIAAEQVRKAEGRPGWEGEAGGFMMLILLPLALYTLPFAVATTQQALERGSQPVSVWRLLLALVPTIGLALLFALA